MAENVLLNVILIWNSKMRLEKETGVTIESGLLTNLLRLWEIKLYKV